MAGSNGAVIWAEHLTPLSFGFLGFKAVLVRTRRSEVAAARERCGLRPTRVSGPGRTLLVTSTLDAGSRIPCSLCAVPFFKSWTNR